MSTDRLQFGSNIRNYIELNNSLELAGIGRLVKVDKDCLLSTNTNFIFPGTTILELENSDAGNDSSFVRYLSDLRDLTLENAQVLYKKFCAEISFELETKGSALFFGLGQFVKKGKISTFQMNDSALKVQTFGLPVLSLVPLELPVKEEKKIAEKEVKKIKTLGVKDRKDRNFLINTAAVAAIFMLLVFAYHYYGPSEPANQLSHLKVDQDRLNKDPEKILISEKFIPELIPGMIEEEVEEVTTCALIIGSFSRRSNALEIQQKVLAAGYELFTEEHQDLYRVGVSMPCEEIQGAAFRSIEKEFGFDPWLRIMN